MSDEYEAYRPYSEALGYAVRKAGVTCGVKLSVNSSQPMNKSPNSRPKSASLTQGKNPIGKRLAWPPSLPE